MSYASRCREAGTIEEKLDVIAEGLDAIAPKSRVTSSDPGCASNVENLDVHRVFNHWKQTMKKPAQTRLTPERREKIKARLKNYSVEHLCRAIDGCAGSDFHMGREMGRHDRVFNELTLILRSDSKMEEFANMAVRSQPDRRKFLG
jgi:hypothetical protein